MHATATATPTTMGAYGDDDDDDADDDDDNDDDDDDLGLRATLARNTSCIMLGLKPHVQWGRELNSRGAASGRELTSPIPMANYAGNDDEIAMPSTTTKIGDEIAMTSTRGLVSRVAFEDLTLPSIEDAARGEYEFRLTRRRRRSSPSSSIAVVVTPQALAHRRAVLWVAGDDDHPRRPRPRSLALDGVQARRRR